MALQDDQIQNIYQSRLGITPDSSLINDSIRTKPINSFFSPQNLTDYVSLNKNNKYYVDAINKTKAVNIDTGKQEINFSKGDILYDNNNKRVATVSDPISFNKNFNSYQFDYYKNPNSSNNSVDVGNAVLPLGQNNQTKTQNGSPISVDVSKVVLPTQGQQNNSVNIDTQAQQQQQQQQQGDISQAVITQNQGQNVDTITQYKQVQQNVRNTDLEIANIKQIMKNAYDTKLKQVASSGGIVNEAQLQAEVETELAPLRNKLENLTALRKSYADEQSQLSKDYQNEINNSLKQSNLDIAKQRLEFATKNIKNGGFSNEDIQSIGDGIINGTIDPTLKGTARANTAIKAYLVSKGFNLAKAQLDYTSTQKYLSTLNSSTQVRLKQAITSVSNALPNVKDRFNNLQNVVGSGITSTNGQFIPLNKVKMSLARNGLYGQDVATAVASLDTALNVVIDELGSVFKGGNSPTDKTLELAEKLLNSDLSVPAFEEQLKQLETSIHIRESAINSLSPNTGSDNNPYFRGGNNSGNPHGAVDRNNLGNIIDTKTGTFRKFETPEQGAQALINDINAKKTGATSTGLTGNSSLSELISKYAPKEDNNNPQAYTNAVVKNAKDILGIDIKANTPIRQIDSKNLGILLSIQEKGAKYKDDIIKAFSGIDYGSKGSEKNTNNTDNTSNVRKGLFGGEKPSLFAGGEALGQDIKKRFNDIVDTFQDKTHSKTTATLNVIGQLAGLVGDVAFKDIPLQYYSTLSNTPILGDIVVGGAEGVKQLFKKASQNPIIQSGLEALSSGVDSYNRWAEENPNASKDIENVINIAGVFPAGKVIGATGKTAQAGKQIFKEAVKDVGQGVGQEVKYSYDKAKIAVEKKVTGRTEEEIFNRQVEKEIKKANKVTEKAVNDYGLKALGVDKKVAKNPEKTKEAIKNAFTDIVRNKSRLVEGKTPDNFLGLQEATNNRKADIYKRYTKQIISLGEEANKKTFNNTINTELKNIIKEYGNKVKTTYGTSDKSEIGNIMKELEVIVKDTKTNKVTPLALQDYIQSLNQRAYTELTNQVKNPVAIETSKKLVDMLDNSVSSLQGAKYGELRRLYGSYKEIEKLVADRVKQELKKNTSNNDLINKFSNLEFIASIITHDPVGATKALGFKFGNSFLSKLNSPDTALKKLFEKLEKNKTAFDNS